MDDVANNYNMESYSSKNMDADDNDSGYLHPECSIGNLEAVAREAALADGLISFGSEHGSKHDMKMKKAGLRRGKWTTEEEFYATRLIYEFKLGLLPLTDGTTLRTFLSKLLNCDPMRISKKFVGQNCIGKQVFRRRQQDLEKLSPEQIEVSRKELAELERKFLERVAQTNRIKGSSGGMGKNAKDGRADYEDENGNSVMAPWMIPPDHTGGQYLNGENSTSGEGLSPRGSRGMNSMAAAALAGSSNIKGGMNLRPPANSQQDDEKNRNSYKQYGGYSDSQTFPYMSSHQYPLNQFYGANLGGSSNDKSDSGTGNSHSHTDTIPNVSSLDLLCNIDGHRLSPPHSTDNHVSFNVTNNRPTADDPHLMNSNPSSSAAFSNMSSFASMYGPNYFPWANLNGSGSSGYGTGGSETHPDAAPVGGGHINRAVSDEMSKSSSLGGFNPLIEWPSMNNLVAAAETMKSVDDLASLGISTSDSMGLLGNIRGYLSSNNLHDPHHGHLELGLGLHEPSITTMACDETGAAPSSEEEEKQSHHLLSLHHQQLDVHNQHPGDHDVGYPLEDGPTVVASALALAASGSSSSASVNCSSLIVDATSHIYNQGKVSELVRHPAVKLLDSADSSQVSLPLSTVINNQMAGYLANNHNNGSDMISSPRGTTHSNTTNNAIDSSDANNSTPLQSGSDSHQLPPPSTMFYDRSVMVGSEPLNDHMDNTDSSHSTSLHNDDIITESKIDVTQQQSHHMSLRAGSSKLKSPAAEPTIQRNSSVENFWMLVGMGDLPLPDKNVLSDLVWSQRLENIPQQASDGDSQNNNAVDDMDVSDGGGNIIANDDNSNNNNNNQESCFSGSSNSNKESTSSTSTVPHVKYDLQRYNPLRTHSITNNQLPLHPINNNNNNGSNRVRKEPTGTITGGDSYNTSAKRSRSSSNETHKGEGEKQSDISIS